MLKSFFLILLFIISSQPVFSHAKHNTANFISITDIHFDPFLICKQIVPCPQVDELKALPSNQWGEILTKYDTQPVYGKDTPYSLLKSALIAAQQETSSQHAHFVLLLGDALGHGFKKNYQFYTGDKTAEGYQKFVKKTFEFLTEEITNAFPDINVYTAIGNNDSYEDNYVIEPQQAPFYIDMAALWSSMIKDPVNQLAMQKDFNTQGYYAIDEDNLHIVVLNTTLFSVSAIRPIHSDAIKELEWLHNELIKSHSKKQKVLIVMHIPIGIDVYASLKKTPFSAVPFWKPEYSDQFESLLKSYSSEISAVLAGHTHSDWFEVLTHGYPKEIPVSLIPSISPQNGNNPAFKLFSYSTSSGKLIDFTTVYYALGDKKAWRQEYNFSDIYKPEYLDDDIVTGMDNIQKTGALADYYKSYFAVGTNTQPITKDNKWIPYYWCAIRSITTTDYQDCIHNNNK